MEKKKTQKELIEELMNEIKEIKEELDEIKKIIPPRTYKIDGSELSEIFKNLKKNKYQ